ncbi:MAG: SH3 domain-containing protein [Acidobacteriaceae bacterium]|nr:SH3 domain-containing protein [Acidobacteriaceae bacterium]
MRQLLRLALISALLVMLLLAIQGCANQSSDVLGEAYVAPATLNLRRELAQKNSVVAVLKYGERVAVIDVRRRFVKIRAANGAEGWVDSLQLLSTEQMEQIRKNNQRALTLPSEGAATVYEALNIHLDPSRQSPAFARIPEGGSVAVLEHQLQPKTAAPARPTLVFDRPQQLSRRQRRERQSRNKSNLPPLPPPPKPPANWQELSAERIDGSESTADLKANKDKDLVEKKAAELKKPVVLEDWTLVRTKSNQCGWVLSRNLTMSIPDEVAQYAEGKRITSYFDLGAVNDDVKGLKHNWLWTTAAGGESYDFDAWRVFLWNRHRHRYETSYRQRDVEGYFPVHVDPQDASATSRTFELITKDDDGKFRRRSYLFDGTRVHLAGTEDYRPSASAAANKPGALDTNKLQAKMPRSGWFKRQWTALKRRVFGSD